MQALTAGDVDLVLTDGTAGKGYVAANSDTLKLVGEPLGAEDFGFIFPKGSDLVAPVNAAIAELEGRRDPRGAEQEVVPRLQAGRVGRRRCRRAEAREFPWWLAAVAAIGAVLLGLIVVDPVYRNILALLSKGVGITVFVTVVAFALASALGLGLAVCVLSGSAVLRNAARFYIEVMRGLPILVLLLYIAFVVAPAIVAGWNALAGPAGLPALSTRDLSLMWRAILALALAYAAFIAEVFRAGIQSVPAGQVEAAKALGLSGWQRFRLVVFPQAIRTILPPLGNDFVALVKDFEPGLGARGRRHHPARQGLCSRVVPLLRDLQRRGLPLPDDDARAVARFGRSSGGCGRGRGVGSVRTRQD